MAKNKYKVCGCSEAFSDVRICCTGCGKSGLTANETAIVESTNFNESLPFLTPSQNRKRALIEAQIKERAGDKRLQAAYRALGLSEAESVLAASVESRLRVLDEDLFKK